jgi:hypothetical protein
VPTTAPPKLNSILTVPGSGRPCALVTWTEYAQSLPTIGVWFAAVSVACTGPLVMDAEPPDPEDEAEPGAGFPLA